MHFKLFLAKLFQAIALYCENYILQNSVVDYGPTFTVRLGRLPRRKPSNILRQRALDAWHATEPGIVPFLSPVIIIEKDAT